jgi:hypothetical protein
MGNKQQTKKKQQSGESLGLLNLPYTLAMVNMNEDIDYFEAYKQKSDVAHYTKKQLTVYTEQENRKKDLLKALDEFWVRTIVPNVNEEEVGIGEKPGRKRIRFRFTFKLEQYVFYTYDEFNDFFPGYLQRKKEQEVTGNFQFYRFLKIEPKKTRNLNVVLANNVVIEFILENQPLF